jgi:hypothetical protein
MDTPQFVKVRKNRDAFGGFTSNLPTFPPTYRYEVGNCDYDTK